MIARDKNGNIYSSKTREHNNLVITGVHPNSVSVPKKKYTFWCSDYLFFSGVHVGQLVSVQVSRNRRKKGVKSVIYVTEVKERTNKEDFKPKRLAKHFYNGDKYNDFVYPESMN